MIEVEVRVEVMNRQALEARLRAQAAFEREILREDVYMSPVGQAEQYLVPPDRFRLRLEDGHATVTTKARRSLEGTEVNDEHEFRVSDPLEFFWFAHSLGYEAFVIKRKHVRLYRQGRVALELTEVQHLGDSLEVEILVEHPSEVPAAQDELRAILRSLEIDPPLDPFPGYVTRLRQKRRVRYRFDPTRPGLPFVEIED